MAKFVRHHVRGVLGPAEAGLDQREARLHEDHQHGADDDPQQVDLRAEDLDVAQLLRTGRAGRQRRDADADHARERDLGPLLRERAADSRPQRHGPPGAHGSPRDRRSSRSPLMVGLPFRAVAALVVSRGRTVRSTHHLAVSTA